jgi:hypothetical protein
MHARGKSQAEACGVGQDRHDERVSELRALLGCRRASLAIGHDDAIHSGIHGRMGVGHRLDGLEHDGTMPIIAEELEVLPPVSWIHPEPSLDATAARSSPAARRLQNASRSGGKAGCSSGRTGTPMHFIMRMESDVPTCTPTAAAKGRYVISRSCGH